MMKKMSIASRLLALLLLTVWTAACASVATLPATPAPAQPPTLPAEPTPAPTHTPTEAPPPTPTPAPTATATTAPTATQPPTATPAPLAAEAVQGWCLPEDATLAMIGSPLDPAAGARIGALENGALEIRNLPALACVFSYTLNNPAPEGLQLQVFEARAAEPWLTAQLAPVEGSPNIVAATLRHTYIIAPPRWDWSYTFALVDSATGTELRRDTVNMHRWEPELCWNQRKPNVITGLCPLPQDQHPWDPWYGKPMPTGEPEEDD